MEPTPYASEAGEREKRWVALMSVVAAVGLTGMKLVVGLGTGSLGILSEALHSSLDLVAALVTLWAVRAAGRPADADHPYGHGKVENLSALLETVLLLVTCAWIVYEATNRLFFHAVEVDASIWAFAVVVVSIVIDVSRSRALTATAKKYNSQALEADALHFSTDVWSSSVVLVGLACVALAGPLQAPWLMQADAVAALGVAGIVIWVSLRLGKKSVDDLLDAAPKDLQERIARAAAVPGVTSVDRARVRRSGPETFVDLSLTAAADQSFEVAHDLTRQVEDAVRAVVPRADVVVHLEPATAVDGEDPIQKVHRLAARRGLRAHAVAIEGTTATLHVELAPELPLTAAHELVTTLESDVLASVEGLMQVVTHIEPANRAAQAPVAPPPTVDRVRLAVEDVCARTRGCGAPHAIEVRARDQYLDLSFHCVAQGDLAVAEAHSISEALETALRVRLPALRRVTIHVEPTEPR
ncbi:MAG: cation diffusion facilitator family transporter [Polyangiaceae bacterium]|nr:cation diffusion facilitator family transporter [Polyangiaceae bacterium]